MGTEKSMVNSNRYIELGPMPIIPTTARQRQKDLRKLEVNIIYIVSPMSELQNDPFSNKKLLG